MNRRIVSPCLAVVLGLGGCAFRNHQPVLVEPAGGASNDASLWKSITSADVVYIGEVHNNQRDHEYELQLVKNMLAYHFRIAVGWEMFARTNQPLLDKFDRHQISLEQLLDQTGFKKSWGVYSPVYAKILATTAANGIPNIALNATNRLVHRLAMGQTLNPAEQKQVPTGYKVRPGAFENFVNLLGDHPGMAAADLHRYFDAQNTWDQTMADSIVEFHRQNPETKIIVLTGRAHVQGGFGVPSYVAQKANLRQLVLFPPLGRQEQLYGMARK
jgi:aminopeptidase N